MSESSVLLVEDDAEFLLSLREYLEDAGFKVSATANCAEAATLAASGNFAAAVVDVNLESNSDGKGLLVARAVRASNPRTRVILISAMEKSQLEHKSETVDADLCMVKPVSGEALVKALRNGGGGDSAAEA